MARSKTGLAITIKAFLTLKPNDLEQNLAALTLAKEAHETGDYSKLIAAAEIDSVGVAQKTRRVDDEPAEAEAGPLLAAMTTGAAISTGEPRVDRDVEDDEEEAA